MKINSIINFKTRERFLTPKMQNNLKTVLTKMNDLTEYQGTQNTFSTKIVKLLETDKNVRLWDDRMFVTKVPPERQMEHTTIFTIGRTKLMINNANGKIIHHKKPFFQPWKSVMKKAEKFLQIFAQNFDNQQIVRRKSIQFSGFTQKGVEYLEKLAKPQN